MGLFGTSSPFDQDVDKVTSEANTTEDWGLIMDICDRVNANPNAPKDALRSIARRMKSPVPHVAMQSLTLLAACINNCGKAFQLEVSSRDFCAEARMIISRGHPKVSEKLRQLLKEWAEGEFKTDAALNLIVQLYTSLKQEGYDFSGSQTPTPKSAPVSKDPNVVSSQQEEDDIAKAIQLSLQSNHKSSGGVGSSSGVGSGGGNLYPSASNYSSISPVHQPVKRESRKVKALYDFEAAEDNELTFKSGEIISVLDDSDANWWKGENFRGSGLFPSNFVTADLTAETEADIKAREKKVSFDESVEVRTIAAAAAPQEVTINSEQMESCLEMLQNADPTEERPDTQDMLVLEDTCNRMGPLIDNELESVDRQHADLTGLNHRLMEAFSMYHKLMKEAPVYGYQLKNFPQQQQPGMMPPPAGYPGMPQQQYNSIPSGQQPYMPPSTVGQPIMAQGGQMTGPEGQMVMQQPGQMGGAMGGAMAQPVGHVQYSTGPGAYSTQPGPMQQQQGVPQQYSSMPPHQPVSMNQQQPGSLPQQQQGSLHQHPQQPQPPAGIAMTTTAYTHHGSLPTGVQGPPSMSQSYPVTTAPSMPQSYPVTTAQPTQPMQGQPPPQSHQQQLLM